MRTLVHVLTAAVFLAPFVMVGFAVWIFWTGGIRRALTFYFIALLLYGVGLALWLSAINLAVRPN